MKELDIKVGFQCNNNCIFCLNRDKKDFKVFPIEQIKRQIASFSKKQGNKKLIIYGGEPLISKNFFKILDFAKENGIDHFEIQTNGRMLAYKGLVKKLKEYGIITFLLSLHFPTRELYKKYMQADGFDQVIKGMENLVEFGFRKSFTVNTVVMKQTLPYLDDIIKLIIKKGASRTQYRFIDGNNIKDRYKEFVPRYKEASPVINKIIDNYQNKIKITVREFPLCILGEKYKNNLSPKSKNRINLALNNKLFTEETIEEYNFANPIVMVVLIKSTVMV